MKLDRTTYEAWLLDRAEGALAPEQEKQLDAFLKAHPELVAGTGELPTVQAGDEHFHDKGPLLRTFPPTGMPDAARLDDFLTARMEGDLSPAQELELGRYLYNHPEAARNAALMAKAKVEAEALPYKQKAVLEKHFPPHGLPDSYRLPDFLIAAAEGDLTADQHAALVQYLHDHPETPREQRLVAAAHIRPAPMAYPWKEQLLKRESRVLPLWARWAAAASILLFISLGLLLQFRGDRNDASLAQRTRPSAPAAPLPAKPAAQETASHTAPPTQVNRPVQENTAGRAPTNAGKQVKREAAPAERLENPREETQVPVPVEPELAEVPAAPLEPTAPASPAHQAAPAAPVATSQGQNLAVFAANQLRGDVLATPKRSSRLDGNDLLAMADRAVGAISNGAGGVQVQRSATREKIRFSLGRNFAISASRAR